MQMMPVFTVVSNLTGQVVAVYRYRRPAEEMAAAYPHFNMVKVCVPWNFFDQIQAGA